MASVQFHQPFCRFLNIVRAVFFADLVTSSALWLAGGDSKYLEDNVTKFSINQSVFDLALIRFLLAISFVLMYSEIECLTIQAASKEGSSDKCRRKKLVYTILICIFSIASLAYSIVKCAFIIEEDKKHPKVIHATYHALAISSVAFSAVEFIAFFINVYVMRRAGMHFARIAENGDDPSESGKSTKQSANIGRLLSLAKPVSYLSYIPFSYRAVVAVSGMHEKLT